MNELKGRKIVMIAGDGFEDMELMYPLFRLMNEAGADVSVAGPKELETLTGKNGMKVVTEASFKDIVPGDFDALVIPGGGSPDHIRIFPEVIKLVQDFDKTGKPIASICHGVQVLITARLLKGKDATGWKSLEVDIQDAGAKYIDKPLVMSGQYIFSRQPSDLGFFCDAIIQALSPGKSVTAAEMARA